MPLMFPRFRRILHTSFFTLSVVFALVFAAGALFPLNFGPYPAGYRNRSVSTFFVSSYNHLFELYFLTHPLIPRAPGREGGIHDAGRDIEFPNVFYCRGFNYTHLDYIDNYSGLVMIRGHDFILHDWLLAAAFFLLTVVLALPFLRRLRRQPLPDPHARPCPRCRYDLRVHLEGKAGDKCPECGRPIVTPTSTDAKA